MRKTDKWKDPQVKNIHDHAVIFKFPIHNKSGRMQIWGILDQSRKNMKILLKKYTVSDSNDKYFKSSKMKNL